MGCEVSLSVARFLIALITHHNGMNILIHPSIVPFLSVSIQLQ